LISAIDRKQFSTSRNLVQNKTGYQSSLKLHRKKKSPNWGQQKYWCDLESERTAAGRAALASEREKLNISTGSGSDRY
jgi:hypothetical protein